MQGTETVGSSFNTLLTSMYVSLIAYTFKAGIYRYNHDSCLMYNDMTLPVLDILCTPR